MWRRPSDAAGMTLVEVLFASAILGTALVSIGVLFAGAARSPLASRGALTAYVAALDGLDARASAAAVGAGREELGREGAALDESREPPVYERLWRVDPIPGAGSPLLRIEVCVRPLAQSGRSVLGTGSCLTTVRARRP